MPPWLPLWGNVINLSLFWSKPPKQHLHPKSLYHIHWLGMTHDCGCLTPLNFCLSIKRISADEFPYQAGGRDFVIHIRLQNKVQDFYDSPYLFIAAVLGLYGGQKGENMFLQDRKLIQRGAVENHVCVFLIRKNPSFSPCRTESHMEMVFWTEAPRVS